MCSWRDCLPVYLIYPRLQTLFMTNSWRCVYEEAWRWSVKLPGSYQHHVIPYQYTVHREFISVTSKMKLNGADFFSWGCFIHKDWFRWFRGFVSEKSILEIDHMNPNIPFNCTASPCQGVILYGELLKGSKPIWQILILVNSVNWNTLIPRVYVG